MTRPTNGNEGTSGIEIASAIILGVAATLTALAAFLAAMAGGEELENFTTSSSKLADANFFYQQGNQTIAQDNQLFVAYLEASQSGTETAFITDLMSPELVAAIEEWETADELLTPFESEAYEIGSFETAKEFEDESQAALVDAKDVGKNGDFFDLAAVVFAAALFAAGIIQPFRSAVLQRGLLGLAVALCVGGVVVLGQGL